jgi:hypothetical protein
LLKTILMFEEIIIAAKTQVSTLLQQKHGIEPIEADKTAEIIGKSFMSTVQQQIEKKDFSGVKEIFSGNTTTPDNPEVQKMIPLLSKSLADNGIEPGKADAISTTVTPELFNVFNDKVILAKQNGIDIPAMIEKFGSNGFGTMSTLMSMAGGFLKGGKSGMMSDLLSKFMK